MSNVPIQICTKIQKIPNRINLQSFRVADNPEVVQNCAVYVDGILQTPKEDYEIRSDVIKFTRSIFHQQEVQIVAYGIEYVVPKKSKGSE